MSRVLWVLPFFCLFCLPGCLSSGNAAGTDFVPSVQIECTVAQATDCSTGTGSGKTAFIGLLYNSSVDCGNYLFSLLTTAQRTQAFDVSSTVTTSTYGQFVIGLFTNWTNSSGALVDTMKHGTYQACSFIDINGNGRLDVNEPVGEGAVTMGNTDAVVSDWESM